MRPRIAPDRADSWAPATGSMPGPHWVSARIACAAHQRGAGAGHRRGEDPAAPDSPTLPRVDPLAGNEPPRGIANEPARAREREAFAPGTTMTLPGKKRPTRPNITGFRAFRADSVSVKRHTPRPPRDLIPTPDGHPDSLRRGDAQFQRGAPRFPETRPGRT